MPSNFGAAGDTYQVCKFQTHFKFTEFPPARLTVLSGLCALGYVDTSNEFAKQDGTY
jgi:hypothetical protein